MAEDKRIIDIVSSLREDLYNLVSAIVALKTAAYPYAKDDKEVRHAIKRISKILGEKV